MATRLARRARSTCSRGRRAVRACCGAVWPISAPCSATGSRVAFNGMYNRTADNEARIETRPFRERGHRREDHAHGLRPARGALGAAQRRARVRKPSIRLGGDRERRAPRRAGPVGVRAGCRRPAPTVVRSSAGSSTGNGGAVRTFSALDEHSVEGKGDYQLGFNALRPRALAQDRRARTPNDPHTRTCARTRSARPAPATA